MKGIQPIEYNNQRVVTTQLIAEAYGTDVKNINDNYQNNREHYTLGKHYFLLEKYELKKFKNHYPENIGVVDRAPRLYLWTEKGAFLHAKSLGTNKAWEVYETLVDEYFRLVRQAPQQKEFPINDRWEMLLGVAQVEDHFSVQYAMNQNLYSMNIHKLQWDDDARPDGSQGGLFSRFMNGEKFPGCDVEPPPFDDPLRSKIKKEKQLVYVDPKTGYRIYGEVLYYPDEYRGYYERWYKRWWFPLHGEKYLSGDVRPGIPRVKNQEKIPEVMRIQTHNKWEPKAIPTQQGQKSPIKRRNDKTA